MVNVALMQVVTKPPLGDLDYVRLTEEESAVHLRAVQNHLKLEHLTVCVTVEGGNALNQTVRKLLEVKQVRSAYNHDLILRKKYYNNASCTV